MGVCFLIGFFAIGAAWMCFVFYSLGYEKGMEDLESDYEEIEKDFETDKKEELASDTDTDISRYRKHRSGSVCADDPIRWNIEPPSFLKSCLNKN